ncbi:MAG: cation:dicarboxylase symporter family transporter [candidate division Zixibacteria bacterium]|nr:cation:dicarboxylase symporter family transporter [candidate division Zixibacteria bacterium]MDD5425657.1 cation:dicarboxylase symporter family transporter [candidate division Zixibacteria bacterium]
MSGKTTNLILLGMLLGVVLGGVLGFYAADFMLAISLIGELFVNALTFLALPLILVSLVVGVTAMGDYRKLGKVSGKIIWYFFITSVLAVVVGIVITQINFGGKINTDFDSVILRSGNAFHDYARLINGNGMFRGVISNVQYFTLVLLVLVFGGILAAQGSRNIKNIRTFFKEVHDSLLKLFNVILYLAPLGIFSLVGTAVVREQENLGKLTAELGTYLAIITAAFLIMGLVILPLFLKIFGHQSPGRYLVGMLPSLFTALGTSSSTSTLPVTYEGVINRNKIDQRAASLVLPLGTLFNVGATAMWLVMTIIFISQAHPGVNLSILQIILVAVVSLVVSIGLAGVPLPGLALSVVVVAAGLPPEILAGTVTVMMAGWVIDRFRSGLNVWGDAIGAAVIAESLEFKAVGYMKKSSQREVRGRGTMRGRRGGEDERQRPDIPRKTRRETVSQTEKKSYPSRYPVRQAYRDNRDNRSGAPSWRESSGQSSRTDKTSPFEITGSAKPDFEMETTSEATRKEIREDKPEPRRPHPAVNRPKAVESRQERKTEPPRSEKKSEIREPKVDILDNEVFKKELARVSAHLHSIENKKREPLPETISGSEEIKEIEAADTGASYGNGEVNEEGITPKIDFLEALRKEQTGDNEVSREDESARDFSAESNETEDISKEEELEELQYGRSRYRRPEKSKNEEALLIPVEDLDDLPQPEDSFSNENITFGRTKKKKTR